jgi:hypothetical protein
MMEACTVRVYEEEMDAVSKMRVRVSLYKLSLYGKAKDKF